MYKQTVNLLSSPEAMPIICDSQCRSKNSDLLTAKKKMLHRLTASYTLTLFEPTYIFEYYPQLFLTLYSNSKAAFLKMRKLLFFFKM